MARVHDECVNETTQITATPHPKGVNFTNMEGQLYIVSAPSGVGKTTLLHAVTQRLKFLSFAVSHTSRTPRANECEAIHYFFVSHQQFQEKIQANLFLEHAEVFGHLYGTSLFEVESKLKQGLDVILEIDWQGARQVRQHRPDAISIFICPPSIQTLQQRLTSRNQDAPSVIERRMADAKKEISHYNEYDFLVVNDDFEVAQQSLESIFIAQRLRLNFQVKQQANLLANLLSSEA